MDTVLSCIDNNSDTTIISFTGMSHGFGVSGDFKKEFLKLSEKINFNIMFVADKEISWYNDLDIEKIKSKIFNKRIITIGNSMGGYNAIQIANDIEVTKVIAFSIQYSIHPEIVPEDERWKKESKKIKKWKYKHLIFNDKTDYYIFGGDNKEEMYHMNMIPNQLNIHKNILKGGHNVAACLKKQGSLYSTINDIIEV